MRFDSTYRTIESCALVADLCQNCQLTTLDSQSTYRIRPQQDRAITILSTLMGQPRSRIIRVGFLEKMSTKGRGFQPRMVLLFTDRLVYFRILDTTNMHLKVCVSLSFHSLLLISSNHWILGPRIVCGRFDLLTK